MNHSARGQGQGQCFALQSPHPTRFHSPSTVCGRTVWLINPRPPPQQPSGRGGAGGLSAPADINNRGAAGLFAPVTMAGSVPAAEKQKSGERFPTIRETGAGGGNRPAPPRHQRRHRRPQRRAQSPAPTPLSALGEERCCSQSPPRLGGAGGEAGHGVSMVGSRQHPWQQPHTTSRGTRELTPQHLWASRSPTPQTASSIARAPHTPAPPRHPPAPGPAAPAGSTVTRLLRTVPRRSHGDSFALESSGKELAGGRGRKPARFQTHLPSAMGRVPRERDRGRAHPPAPRDSAGDGDLWGSGTGVAPSSRGRLRPRTCCMEGRRTHRAAGPGARSAPRQPPP